MLKLVIFDLDGTLLNTIDDICDSYNAALKDLNLPSISLDDCKYVVGKGVRINVDNCLKKILKDDYNTLKDQYYEKMLDKYESYYIKYQKNKTSPYPGIIEMLKKLQDMGIKIAVLSNKEHTDVINVMKYYFKDIVFDYVQGVSCDVRVKPSSDGINKIKNALMIKDNKEILYIGDSETDILTARNAGLDCIACTWGFRKVEEIKHADYLAYQASDIIKIIKDNYYE